MVKKVQASAPPVRRSRRETRHRHARVAFRLHANLRGCLDFLSYADNRTLSQFIEIILIRYCQQCVTNRFDRTGGPLTPADAGPPWHLRPHGPVPEWNAYDPADDARLTEQNQQFPEKWKGK